MGTRCTPQALAGRVNVYNRISPTKAPCGSIRRVASIRITNAHGVQEHTHVTLGGIEQYVQIRGEDRRNPVILWLHGGQCTVPDYSSRSGDGALSAPTAECTRGLYARQ